MRVALPGVGEPDVFQVRPRPRPRFPPGQAAHQAVRLGDLTLRAHQRIERQPGLLRQHRDAASPERAEAPGVARVEIVPVERHAALRRKRRRQRAHQCLRQETLARAGLAENDQRLAGVEVQ